MIDTAARTNVPLAQDHDEAMARAGMEYERLLALVDDLTDDDWTRPTDCTEWDVRAMLGHLLGMLELLADRDDMARQQGLAAATAAEQGCLHLDALTALQVAEHASLSTPELVRALHDTAPKALAARRATTAEFRAMPFDPHMPGESGWTFGYLLDVIQTRDPWLHRVDICRATGRELVLTAEHDGCIVADVVADWAARHAQPFDLTLTGPAGGHYVVGDGGPEITQLTLDAVEFCRVLSGRAPGSGLLATPVVF
jgi:uncharacterized protein (TIGR03083 family)